MVLSQMIQDAKGKGTPRSVMLRSGKERNWQISKTAYMA